ncbi:MAG: hypothetical protein HY849_06315 [Nitrosomonadales bacterium]|nr:hypothetical protein [Nitrosomonadales bacterium]
MNTLKKIEDFSAVAPKLKTGKPELEYCLWVDSHGALYVQMLNNSIGSPSPGKHSKNLLFLVSDFLEGKPISREVKGINPGTFKMETMQGSNNSAFIRAIVKHLVPDKG